MHVAQLGFFRDRRGRAPAELLRDWPTLSAIAHATASAGVRTTVVQLSSVPGHVREGDVDFYFVARQRDLHELAGKLAPDVFHLHGLGFPQQLLALREQFPLTPILLQDHAEPLPHWWVRHRWRRAAAAVSAVCFAHRLQAEPFIAARIYPPEIRIYELPETACEFRTGDQALARTETGVHGDPALLWVGHLNGNKDPLTVLAGLDAALPALPNLQLWCCYGQAPLLDKIRRELAAHKELGERVHLLGPVPHSRIETLLHAADLFVLGSHREGCSFAVIEALAAGTLPVVTDIPSNRMLTADGRFGALWQPGDPVDFSSKLLSAASQSADSRRSSVRRHFEESLSPKAIGRRLSAIYAELQ